jgi:alpha-ketoglutarate-dependent taurine dioxygenase
MINTPASHNPAADLPDLRDGDISVVRPAASGEPLESALERVDEIRTALARDAVVALSGYEFASPARFSAFVSRVAASEAMGNFEARTGRSEVADGVFTTTDHPESDEIILHSEKAHTNFVPEFLALYCDVPPAIKGGTVVAFSDEICSFLDQNLVDKLRASPVRYERNYFTSDSLSMSWTRAFRTSVQDEVEAYLTREGVSFRWIGQNDLHTEWSSTSFVTTVSYDRPSWCNAIINYEPRGYLSNAANPDRQIRALRLLGPERRLPFDCCWQDGTAFSAEEMASMLESHRRSRRVWRWQRGDLLLINNTRTLHGREPFRGDRRILFIMTKPLRRRFPQTPSGVSSLFDNP